MARIYLKKVNTLKQNCGGCYFFIKNPMHCEAQKNKQVDCFNDNIHCINSNIIFKQIHFERVEDLCRNCYFYLLHCEAQKNKQVDCFNDNIHCINSNIIFKQIHFERVEDLCRNCYFYLSKTPYCFFPEDKNRSDCANNNLIYKEIIKADEL